MVSLWEIFWVFAKIGAFTIGGGYMMIPAIEAEMRKHKWISEEELPDIVAISQSAPGLLTVNMSIFAGYKLRGLVGSIVATFACILAPFLTILLIALFFNSFKDIPWVMSVFQGVRPVAVGIIAGYFVNLIKKQRRWWEWLITLASLFAIAFCRVSAVWILLVLIVGAMAIISFRERRQGR